MSDINVLVPSDRRRAWSAQEKAPLLAEIDAEGGKVRWWRGDTGFGKLALTIGGQPAKRRQWVRAGRGAPARPAVPVPNHPWIG